MGLFSRKKTPTLDYDALPSLEQYTEWMGCATAQGYISDSEFVAGTVNMREACLDACMADERLPFHIPKWNAWIAFLEMKYGTVPRELIELSRKQQAA